MLTAMLFIAAAAQPVTVERVVAVVDDYPILHTDVASYLDPDAIVTELTPLPETPDSLYMAVLEQIIENRLLVEGAMDAGYYPSNEMVQELVDAEVDSIAARAGSMPQLINELIAAGTTMDEYRDALARMLAEEQATQSLVGSRIQGAMQTMPLSSEAFLEASGETVGRVLSPRRMAWIYLPVLPSGPELDVAIQELTDLLAEIEAGMAFEEAAAAHSEDPSAQQGGYLGEFVRGDMVPSFEEAVFSLEPGQVSRPVVTPYGVHLVRLEEVVDSVTVEASHILKLVPTGDEDIQLTLARAEALVDSIRSGRLSFGDAASLYSVDPASRSAGGEIGTVLLSFWNPTLADEAERLEPGDVSEPLLMPGAGVVIVLKRLEDDPSGVDWSDYTEEELENVVRQVLYLETYEALVDSLREEIPVVYNVGDGS